MLIAAGVFLCVIGVIGVAIILIGLSEEEPGAILSGIVIAALGITFGIINFVNYSDPALPELNQRRLGDYVIVTGGSQSLEVHCPRTVPDTPRVVNEVAVPTTLETITEEEKRFKEWEESHHQ